MSEQQQPLISLESQPQYQPKIKVIEKEKEELNNTKVQPVKQDPQETSILSSKGFHKKRVSRRKSKQAKRASENGQPFLISAKSSCSQFHKFKLSCIPLTYLAQERPVQEKKQKARQKKQRQQVIKRLLRERDGKAKQIRYCCPQPLTQKFRTLFTEPQTRQISELRNVFLNLESLGLTSQDTLAKKRSKRNSSLRISITQKQNVSSSIKNLKLPNIRRNENKVFAYGENGDIIDVKSIGNRVASHTTHTRLICKSRVTPLKEIGIMNKSECQFINRPPMSKRLDADIGSLSILSTNCNSMMDSILLQKQIQERSLKFKPGAKLRNPASMHRKSQSELISLPKLVNK